MGCFSSKTNYEPVLKKDDVTLVISSEPTKEESVQLVLPPKIINQVQSYAISHNRWISVIQSILPSQLSATSISLMETDMGNDMDAFYQRMMNGKSRVCSNLLGEQELLVYAGVIGLYYGPNSHKYEHMTKNLVQFVGVNTKWLKPLLVPLSIECKKPIEYTPTFDERDVTIIDDTVTILLLSDFGTGLQRSDILLEEAKKIASSISLIINCGDTYYSGTIKEQEQNFINPIRRIFPYATIRSLRGTHDVYSGPNGFTYVKKTIGQNSSYLSIRNKHMIIQGIDTTFREFSDNKDGKHIPEVREDEVEWHIQCVQEAVATQKKVIFLSYHEPITYNHTIGSSSIPVNTHIETYFKNIMPHIDAYYFGHQHSFMLYHDYTYPDKTILKKPRLIGNGGCTIDGTKLETMYQPAHYDTTTYAIPTLLDGDEWHVRHNGHMMDSGFCILTCTEDTITAHYYTIHSSQYGEYEPAHCIYLETL